MTRKSWRLGLSLSALAIGLLACPDENSTHVSSAKADVKPVEPAAPPPAPSADPAPAALVPTGEWAKGAAPSLKVVEGAVQDLSRWVEAGAKDPRNSWALAHGLLAFGPDGKMADGRKMADVLVGDFAESAVFEGKELVVFPRRSKNGEVAEVHRNLFTKTLLEVGLPLDRVFRLADGTTVELGGLLESALRPTIVPKDDEGWHDFAWTSSALLLGQKLSPKLFEASAAHLDPKALASGMLHYAKEQQAFLEPLHAANKPELLEKKKQFIYSHSCGGLHVIQAAMTAAASLGDAASKKAAREQLELLRFRYRAERRIYAESVVKAPEYELLILVQELKFYGHVLETLGLAHRQGLVEATPELRAEVQAIITDLFQTLRKLGPHYGQLSKIRTVREQTYLDMIGDGCHAIRGLREASVAFFPPS